MKKIVKKKERKEYNDCCFSEHFTALNDKQLHELFVFFFVFLNFEEFLSGKILNDVKRFFLRFQQMKTALVAFLGERTGKRMLKSF